MRRMENLTRVNNRPCIRFRPKTDQDDIFITIQNGSGCSAYVGYFNFTVKIRFKSNLLVLFRLATFKELLSIEQSPFTIH